MIKQSIHTRHVRETHYSGKYMTNQTTNVGYTKRKKLIYVDRRYGDCEVATACLNVLYPYWLKRPTVTTKMCENRTPRPNLNLETPNSMFYASNAD